MLVAEHHRVGFGMRGDEPRHVDIAALAAREIEDVACRGTPDAARREQSDEHADRRRRAARRAPRLPAVNADAKAAAVHTITTGHVGSRNRKYHQTSNGW